MKKVLFFSFYFLLFGFYFVFWWSNDYFEIQSESFFTGSDVVNLILKSDKFDDVKDIKFYIWNLVLDYGWKSNSNTYRFIIPRNVKLNITNLTTKIEIDNKQFYWPDWPYFLGLDLSDLSWGSSVKILGKLTWNCQLVLSNWSKWWISKKDENFIVSIPKFLSEQINWWYIDCDWLKSNYVKFKILPSPKIDYIISKNKKTLTIWDIVLIKGDLFKYSYDDSIQVYLGSEKWSDCKLIDEKTIQCKLPDKNLYDVTVKVVRNWFESNTIKLNVAIYPQIENVTTEYKNWKSYFKIIWFFPYKLWDLKVYYGSKKLQVDYTWKNYIYARFPEVTYFDNKRDFYCDYTLKPDYLKIEIWKAESNKFFVNFDDFPRITKVERPFCDNNGCYIKFYTSNTNWRNIKVFLNGQEVEIYWSLVNLVRIKTNWLVKKGSLKIITDRCLESPEYLFDFTENFKPKIIYVESKSHFKPFTEFKIYWEKLTRDGASGDMQMQVVFTPKNILKEKSLKYWCHYI